ncbi:MAG: hypothetical protein WEA34_15040 [Gemmatimonadota bacterium]
MTLRRPAALLTAILVFQACDYRANPTGPVTEAEPEVGDETGAAPATMTGSAIYSDRAHALPPEAFELLSTREEQSAGMLRYRATEGVLPEVTRDDFIVTELEGGEPVVRRVISAEQASGELRMDTSPAYWHDIVRGGEYRFTIPFDGSEEAQAQLTDAGGPQRIPLARDSLPLPPLEHTFQPTDVCAWVHDLAALLPGNNDPEICGKPRTLSGAIGVAKLGISGTLDSLKIRSGRVRVTGDMDIAMNIDPGGVVGGEIPEFYPCNRGNYLGCVSTPTGAALVEWLRRYAPSIPEASLPPVRVCVPGARVRTRRGFWSGSFPSYTWNPPTWVRCRIANVGELPEIVLPSVSSLDSEVRPNVEGELVVRVQGDGEFEVKVSVPYLAAQTGYSAGQDLTAEAKIGVFILLKTTVKNGGGTVKFTFDDTGRVTQTWSSTAGFGRDFELVEENRNAELLYLDNPDSIVVRVGVPVEVGVEICIAIYNCETAESKEDPNLADRVFKNLNVGAKLGAGASMFYEAIWSRPQVHPTDPVIDNWNVSVEGGYDVSVAGGITIPLTGWALPDVPREFEETWECCRLSVSDYWGQAPLDVVWTTTGDAADVDPDGYRILVERTDSTPGIVDAGAQRLGRAWSPTVHEHLGGPTGEHRFGELVSALPCIAVYSDALLNSSPVWGLALGGARAAGVGVPNYAVATPCAWLIANYQVTLEGVADNCTVQGGPTQEVWLHSRNHSLNRLDPASVVFDIECGPRGTTGDLRVLLPTLGTTTDLPPALAVEGQRFGAFPDSASLLLTRLAPGTRSVQVVDVGPWCVSDPVDVEVIANQVTEVEPMVVCALPDLEAGMVEYRTTLEGGGDDPNGYELRRDGVSVSALPQEAMVRVDGVEAATPTVFHVADIIGSCQPLGPNPQLVTLDGAASPRSVDFPVRCVDAVPDTLIGTVDASGWPTPTVTVRADDGRTLTASGPLATELAALTGTAARVWGVTSATGISVHGYDLRSSLVDDRWMGIVLERPDGVWLFGEEAVRLVDAPPGLVAASGSLVWVSGQQTTEGVRPVLFSIIREAGS